MNGTTRDLKVYKGPIFYVLGGLLFISILFLDKEIETLVGSLGFSANSIVLTVITLFLLTLSTVMFTFMLQDTQLKESIENLKEAMQSINMGWLISEAEVVKIEEKAVEIWVFQSSLEKEYDLEGEIGVAVLNNLKMGKKYVYFLPVHSFTQGQVESFKTNFSDYEDQFDLIPVENDGVFIHSEIVLYDPTSPILRNEKGVRIKGRNAVEFLPSNDKKIVKARYYVDLDDDRANDIWSLGCRLIKGKRKAKVNTSLFMLESKLLKIEAEAEEIWILKNGLGYDIEKGHSIQKQVKINLEKKEFKYKYFLLDDLEGKSMNDKKIFENMYSKYSKNFELIMVPDDGIGLFIHSEIVIYNPSSFGKRQAIEWIPAETVEGSKYSQIYIDLGTGTDRTNEVYRICKKLLKTYGENQIMDK